jgi:hypothetical protein
VPRQIPRRLVMLLAAALLAAGCGSDSGGGQDATGPPVQDATGAPVQEGFSVFVASYDLATGPPSRFMVGLLDASNQPISYGQVTMRFAYLGQQAKASTDAAPTMQAQGSFLPIPGSKAEAGQEGQGRPRATPPSVARGVYAGQVGFGKAGYWGVEVRADLEGVGLRNGTSVFEVGKDHAVPAVGQPAPRTRNLVLTSKGVPKAAIDSRAQTGVIPDAVLHKTTIADSIARKRPAVVVFSTPVYCQSQFCGPITDMVQSLAPRYQADFIHVEIWKNFAKQQLNDAAKQWLYAGGNGNEPWVFVIGTDGKIAARFDNVVTEGELTAVLDKVAR